MYILYLNNIFMYVRMYIFSDKDEYYRIVHASIIVLGIFTCSTSVLLWWLYKNLAECTGRDKYDVEGT